MAWGKKDQPKDTVGKNPTGRERRSSAGKRRQEQRKMDKDLDGTQYEDKKKKD